MTTKNTLLMQQARASLSSKWVIAIITFLIYGLLIGALSAIPVIGTIGSFILGGPLSFGIAKFTLAISRNEKEDVKQLFEGFDNFGNNLIAYLLKILYIFLWSLLFIIPGIIAAISYAMVFFIMVDEPEISPQDALEKSKKLMYGHKWKFVGMNIRFFGWALLCLLTFGIGFLWLIPYMQVSFAKFYEDITTNPLDEIGTEV